MASEDFPDRRSHRDAHREHPSLAEFSVGRNQTESNALIGVTPGSESCYVDETIRTQGGQ